MRAGVPKRWVAVARKAQYGDDGAGAGSVCCWAGSVCLYEMALLRLWRDQEFTYDAEVEQDERADDIA